MPEDQKHYATQPSSLRTESIRFQKSKFTTKILIAQLRSFAQLHWHRKVEMMTAESRKIIRCTSRNMRWIAILWIALILFIGGFKVSFSPTPASDFVHFFELTVPYVLVALAPIMGFVLGRNAFPSRHLRSPNTINLSLIGRWTQINHRDARRHPDFGPTGFMASLIIGMLLNIVLRTIEFAIAIPALSSAAPDWGVALFWLTTAQIVVMNLIYSICFVMALRTVPLFPKMLLLAWILDIGMQLAIAQTASGLGLPVEVAVALQELLSGNINKVLIGIAVWLPYLVLSKRVNVTYRHRISR